MKNIIQILRQNLLKLFLNTDQFNFDQKELVFIDDEYWWKTHKQIEDGEKLAEQIFTMGTQFFWSQPKKLSNLLVFSFFLWTSILFYPRSANAKSFTRMRNQSYSSCTEIESPNESEYRQLYKVFNVKDKNLDKKSVVKKSPGRPLYTDKERQNRDFLLKALMHNLNSVIQMDHLMSSLNFSYGFNSQKELLNNQKMPLSIQFVQKEQYVEFKTPQFLPNRMEASLRYQKHLQTESFFDPEWKEKILESLHYRAGEIKNSFENFKDLLNFIYCDKEIAMIFNFLISLTNIGEDFKKLTDINKQSIVNIKQGLLNPEEKKLSQIFLENKIKIFSLFLFAVAIIYRKTLINFLLSDKTLINNSLKSIFEIISSYEKYLTKSCKKFQFSISNKLIKFFEFVLNEKQNGDSNIATFLEKNKKIKTIEPLVEQKTPKQICQDQFTSTFDKIIKCHPEYKEREEARRQFEVRQELKKILETEPKELKFDIPRKTKRIDPPIVEPPMEDSDYIDLDKI